MLSYQIIYTDTNNPVTSELFCNPQEAQEQMKRIRERYSLHGAIKITSVVEEVEKRGVITITPCGNYSFIKNSDEEEFCHSFPMAGSSWRKKEIRRPKNKRAPWITKDWFRETGESAVHFPHVSSTDQTQLAYTPSEKYGINGRQVRVSVERYFNKHFPDIKTKEVQGYIGEFFRLVYDTVYFAETPDEIERVYREGPSSCMSYTSDNYVSKNYPVRVYGAGDIAIAYVKNNDGKILARTLVRLKTKMFVGIYSSCYTASMALNSLLITQGYIKEAKALIGAKLMYVENNKLFDLPYLDGNLSVSIADQKDGEACLIIKEHRDGQYWSNVSGSAKGESS